MGVVKSSASSLNEVAASKSLAARLKRIAFQKATSKGSELLHCENCSHCGTHLRGTGEICDVLPAWQMMGHHTLAEVNKVQHQHITNKQL